MLDDPKRDVQGLTLPDTTKLTNLMFADDTSLFLRGEPANLDRAMRTLALYCDTLGARTNWHKTVAIWVSKRDRI
jgi:hypothetical protein